jgi:hypothetical protein
MNKETVSNKKKKVIQDLPLKIFASILPALIFTQDSTWLTLNKIEPVWFFWFLIFWVIIVIYTTNLEKYKSLFKIFRLAEIGTFFAPIAVIILALSIDSGIYGVVAGLIVMVISVVIALFFGIIFHFVANSFKKKLGGAVMMENTKKCPDCAELIKKEAKKCRYCGKIFE